MNQSLFELYALFEYRTEIVFVYNEYKHCEKIAIICFKIGIIFQEFQPTDFTHNKISGGRKPILLQNT